MNPKRYKSKSKKSKSKPSCAFICCTIFVVLFIVLCLIPLFFSIDALMSYYNLVIAVFSLATTVGVAWKIYCMQKKDAALSEKARIKKAKKLIASEIEAALHSLILPSRLNASVFAGSDIFEIYSKHVLDLQTGLNLKQNMHLSDVVNLIGYCSKNMLVDGQIEESAAEDGFKLLLRPWIVPIMNSKYRNLYDSISDFRQLLNQETFELLVALNDANMTYEQDLFSVVDKNNRLLFKYYPKEKQYCIYDGQTLLMKGTFGNDEYSDYSTSIADGYEKGETYDGNYKNGQYHGYGCKYDSRHEKYAEGFWENGDIIYGTEYNFIYRKSFDSPDVFVARLGDFSNTMHDIFDELERNGIGQYYICDFHTPENGSEELVNKRSLESFLREKYPSWLKSYNEYLA